MAMGLLLRKRRVNPHAIRGITKGLIHVPFLYFDGILKLTPSPDVEIHPYVRMCVHDGPGEEFFIETF